MYITINNGSNFYYVFSIFNIFLKFLKKKISISLFFSLRRGITLYITHHCIERFFIYLLVTINSFTSSLLYIDLAYN